MISPRDEEYWSGRFDITAQDLHRTASRLARAGSPSTLTAILHRILQGRLEHGHDPSPAAPGGQELQALVRLWDPDGEWQAGDRVLLVHDRFGNTKYEAALGEIMQAVPDAVEVRLDELQATKMLLRTLPAAGDTQTIGSAAEEWRGLVARIVERKLCSMDLNEQAEGLLLQHGGRILTRLGEALRLDNRFTSLEGNWYLAHRLPHIGADSLQAVHHFLLHNQHVSLDDLLPALQEGHTADAVLFKMALHMALLHNPDRFENTGTAARPQWQARLPAPGQAQVTQTAFDPQTFEILCRPGQRLSHRKARRLQELKLYAHVVTFPEWQLATQP